MRFFLLRHKPTLYAFRILLGCLIVWWSLDYLNDEKKIWALISVIAVSDPDFETVRVSALSRIVNTIVGGVIGLLFMYVAGVNFWSLMSAITVSVLISTMFKSYPSSWKLAPSTVAIIMVPGIVDKEDLSNAMHVALTRSGEILYGCLVALVLGIVMTAIRKWIEEHQSSSAQETDNKSNAD